MTKTASTELELMVANWVASGNTVSTALPAKAKGASMSNRAKLHIAQQRRELRKEA